MPVRGEKRGPVYWVILDRPEKLNALDEEMWSSLAEEVGKGCGESAVVALRGNGRAFCTGDDIGAMYAFKTRGDADKFFSAVTRAVKAIARCGRLVAALVHGYAYGGCAEILLLVDLVVAVRGVRISAPEVRLGLIPPLVASLGPLMIGRRARLLSLTGLELGAEEAKTIGLVDHIVDSYEEGIRFIENIASMVEKLDLNAIAAARRISFTFLERMGVLEEAVETLKAMALSSTARERMRLFLEKKLR